MADVPQHHKSPSPSVIEHDSNDRVLLAWSAPQYRTYHKPSWWYAVSGIAAAMLIALTFLLEHFALLQVSPWLASAVIVACVVALITRGTGDAPTVGYGIAIDGMLIDGKVVPYKSFKSFEIIDQADHLVLRLWPAVFYVLPTLIMIEAVNEDKIRHLLQKVIPEIAHEQSWSDNISHIIKF